MDADRRIRIGKEGKREQLSTEDRPASSMLRSGGPAQKRIEVLLLFELRPTSDKQELPAMNRNSTESCDGGFKAGRIPR